MRYSARYRSRGPRALPLVICFPARQSRFLPLSIYGANEMASSPPDTTGKLDLGTHAVPANELKGSTPLSEDSKGESDTKVPDHKILGVDGHLYPNMSAWRRNLLTATVSLHLSLSSNMLTFQFARW